MTLQLNLLILMLGAAQGVILSVLFFIKRKKDRVHLYFSFFLAVVGLQLLLKAISKAWLTENAFPWYIISNQLPYLIGPLIFFYVQARKGLSFRPVDFLHFAPFVLAFFYALVFVYTLRLTFNPWLRAGMQTFFLTAYTFYCLRGKDPRLNRFIILAVAIEEVIILTLAVMQEFYPSFPDVRWLFILLTLMIYWISWQFLSNPETFEVAPTGLESKLKSPAKYAHSNLKDEEANEILVQLDRAMKQQKLYLNPSLTVAQLAAHLKISRHHLSQVINGHLGKTFHEYLNHIRVEEVHRRLGDTAFDRYTIAAIAHDCGFNSLSTFNETFKNRYEVSPSSLRQASNRL